MRGRGQSCINVPSVSQDPTVGLRRATAPDPDSGDQDSVTRSRIAASGQDVDTSGHHLPDSRHVQEGNQWSVIIFPIISRYFALSKRVWSKSYWFLPSADLARWMHFVLIRATRSAMAPLPRSTRPWSSFVKTVDSSTKSWRRWSRVTPWQEMVRFLKYPNSRVFSIISTSRGKCFRLRVVWWGHLWRGCC